MSTPVTAARVRPPCGVCGQPVDRLQPSRGVVVAYPCQHWHSPALARALADKARQLANHPDNERQPA